MRDEPEVGLAEDRLSELQKRLEHLRPLVRERWLAGRSAPDDLEKIMELDAAIERAARHVRALEA